MSKIFRLSGLVTAAGIVVSGATVMGFLGRLSWFFELFSHFRVQYFLSLIVIAVFLAFYKKKFQAFCFAGMAVTNLALIIPLYEESGYSDGKENYILRVFLLNVNSQNKEYDLVIKIIKRFNPDFIALLEMTPQWTKELKSLQKNYPYVIAEPRVDNFGIAIFSRWPIVDSKTLWIGEAGLPSLLMKAKVNNKPFSLLATHPLPPISAEYARLRNQQLIAIAQFAKVYSKPLLLAGDLNISPWSPYFHRLLENAGFMDSALGYGVMPTWPVNNPLFWIPIDHVLYSPGIVIQDRRTGSDVGSDHYPLVVDFSVVGGKKYLSTNLR